MVRTRYSCPTGLLDGAPGDNVIAQRCKRAVQASGPGSAHPALGGRPPRRGGSGSPEKTVHDDLRRLEASEPSQTRRSATNFRTSGCRIGAAAAGKTPSGAGSSGVEESRPYQAARDQFGSQNSGMSLRIA